MEEKWVQFSPDSFPFFDSPKRIIWKTRERRASSVVLHINMSLFAKFGKSGGEHFIYIYFMELQCTDAVNLQQNKQQLSLNNSLASYLEDLIIIYNMLKS